ncbi:uncharacterized protein BJ171DRAFT_162849 [Polychytrium aggregatum]|uniref:uncharacterized protein n=1 Tax=Polychytrium aggregatum TaxID=110093 RepID=UPI0022FEBA79|nr:uncharacterized protein BJ171DRAFT_162849 [Polychytrium aggregatum]KAI9202859.1 hypothetical protein BJ171DRAFT_162849 [Polychytrium aggregatum]
MSFSRQTVVDDSDDDTDLSELTRRDYINSLFRPVPPGQRLLCHIIRYREGRTKMFPHFHMMIEQNDGSPALFALSARKRRKTKTSDYIVSLDSSTNSPNTQMVGRLRSNFIGTGYTGSALKSTPQPGSGGPERPPLVEQVGILYEPNILGLKGPRKISIILPTMNKQDEQNDIPFSKDKEVLLSLIKSDAKKDLVMLHNKPPQWNDETHSYVLSFDGRVTVASVKNFQIVHDHDLDYIVMQFGRVSSNRFNLDIQYPLSPIQGFLIAISSFDRKIACE